MAKQQAPEAAEAVTDKKKLEEEKKRIKQEQKEQRREAKRRAKELSKQQEELDDEGESNSLVTFAATIFIVLLWLAVICAIIKLDIGGFGSKVLAPVLKDVPVINKVLPGQNVTETTDSEAYGGYTSLRDAVEQIKKLELELEQAQSQYQTKDDDIAKLKAEVTRLKEFEDKQIEFQKAVNDFAEEVVYAEKGPGPEEYKKYYETINPTAAEYIYRQVVTQLEESQEIQDYAAAYSQMKPKQAAAIFESMTDNLELVSRILKVMSSEDRGNILGVMDSDTAARLTKIMDPES